MKKTIVIICLAVFGVSLQAQSTEFDELYSAFRGEEGVINVYVPGFLCRWASNIEDLEQEEQELLRSIKSVKVLVIENPDINKQVNLARVLSRVKPDQGIFPLLEVHDGNEDILILAREKDNRISELYVIVGGDENVMVKVSGRMDRDLMKCLYNVTGIEQTKYTREI
ncbi:DUF4252 domain-containing protein [Bacteroidota bacterium]